MRVNGVDGVEGEMVSRNYARAHVSSPNGTQLTGIMKYEWKIPESYQNNADFKLIIRNT